MTLSLLSLYASILVPVYSEWIGVADLCFLDTAVCDKELRKRYLDLLTFCHISDFVNNTDNQFDWLILRGLHLRKMRVSWSPVTKALIQSIRVSFISIVDIHILVENLEVIRENVAEIGVHLLNPFSASQLKDVGSVITELSFCNEDVNTIEVIAASCPGLRKVTASDNSFILPIVDACQLDEINNCHLGSLVKRTKCKWSYQCSLRRTSEVNDEAAVCLGEGKYYQMTHFQCLLGLSKEDTDLLIPLISNLSVICLDVTEDPFLFSAVVEKCHRLTELELWNTDDTDQLRHLLQHSPILRLLNIQCFNNLNFDSCIEALSARCPLLEVCTLKGCVVESESAMTDLFEKCHFLTEFEAREWPHETVLTYADNVETIVIGSAMLTCKSGRGLKKLQVSNRIDVEVLCSLIAQYTVRSVDITDWRKGFNMIIESMALWCRQLVKFRASTGAKDKATALVALRNLKRLTFLSLSHFSFSAESLSLVLENKSSSLLSLTLDDCGITGDMVSVIGKLCPALTSLDLSNNNGIDSGAIVELLKSCCKLEVLSIKNCSLVTSEILSSVKSSSLKQLNANGTDISFSEMFAFGKIINWI